MTGILDINSIALALPGYPLSWVELLGTLTGLACVWLASRGRVLSWPLGIINALFFLALFYQVQLYADMLLQLYFLVTSLVGWWRWTHPKNTAEVDTRRELRVTSLAGRQIGLLALICLVGTVALGFFIVRLPSLLPAFFPKPAAYPFADAFVAVLSVAAQVLLTQKKRESWALWVTVDAVSVGLYAFKGVWLISAEYLVFGVIAVLGWMKWNRELAGSAATDEKDKNKNDALEEENPA